jgi:hypothetical protein
MNHIAAGCVDRATGVCKPAPCPDMGAGATSFSTACAAAPRSLVSGNVSAPATSPRHLTTRLRRREHSAAMTSLAVLLLGSLLIALGIAGLVGPARLVAGLIAMPIAGAIVFVIALVLWGAIRLHSG